MFELKKSFLLVIAILTVFAFSALPVFAGGITVSPSGDYTHPGVFTVTNQLGRDVSWQIACRPEMGGDVSKCHGSNGILKNGATATFGLGHICAGWQLDFDTNFDGRYIGGGDQGYVAQPECKPEVTYHFDVQFEHCNVDGFPVSAVNVTPNGGSLSPTFVSKSQAGSSVTFTYTWDGHTETANVQIPSWDEKGCGGSTVVTHKNVTTVKADPFTGLFQCPLPMFGRTAMFSQGTVVPGQTGEFRDGDGTLIGLVDFVVGADGSIGCQEHHEAKPVVAYATQCQKEIILANDVHEYRNDVSVVSPDGLTNLTNDLDGYNADPNIVDCQKFAFGHDGQLWIETLEGSSPNPVTFDGHGYNVIDIASDGRGFVYAIEQVTHNIVVLDPYVLTGRASNEWRLKVNATALAVAPDGTIAFVQDSKISFASRNGSEVVHTSIAASYGLNFNETGAVLTYSFNGQSRELSLIDGVRILAFYQDRYIESDPKTVGGYNALVVNGQTTYWSQFTGDTLESQGTPVVFSGHVLSNPDWFVSDGHVGVVNTLALAKKMFK